MRAAAVADSETLLLNIHLFGPFEVRVNDAPLPRMRSHKGQWLLALLALRAGRLVERDWLAGMLWPGSPEPLARANLRNRLMDLRRALGPAAGRLEAGSSHTLCLELLTAEADVLAFDAAVSRGDPPSLEQAVALYRGPLLEGCAEEWAFQERQFREQAVLAALEALAARAVTDGDLVTAERHLRRAVAVDPLRESPQRTLMQTLAATGNYAAAFMLYRDLRLLLHREMNQEPDPETTALFQQLRATARSLAVSLSSPLAAESQPSQQRRVEALPPGRMPAPSAAPGAVLSPPYPSDLFPNNLPHLLNRFIGRQPELAEVQRLLDSHRLVTLAGAGGCGKTRLALEVAARLVDKFAEGVWLIELAGLADPELVPQRVATALEVREQPDRPLVTTLADVLKPRQLLLVLDNCEHLIAACAHLAESLLHACPRLRILATSREPLGITGEGHFRVPSLSVPDPQQLPSWEQLTEYEGVCLFVERAAAALPAFALRPENAPSVARICARLDGIPLAIELAAARVTALSVEQISDHLDDRFHLLTGGSRTAPPRHQTLRALIDWSYDLLSEPEQALLRRLSVFAGGWTLEAADVVCSNLGFRVPSGRLDFELSAVSEALGPDPSGQIQNPKSKIQNDDVLDLLAALVAKSLVMYEEHGATARYRLMETVGQYARDRLLETEETPVVRGRHLDWFLALAERAEPELHKAEQVLWLARLEREHDNFRAALAWAAESETGDAHNAPRGSASGTAGLRLAGALGHFWVVRGHVTEGRRWLEGALSGGGGGDSDAPGAARAAALTALGTIAWCQGDLQAARARCEEGMAMARNMADKRQLAHSLLTLGLVAFFQCDYGAARACEAESLALSQQLGDRSGIAGSMFLRGHLATLDDPAVARSHYEESLAIFRELEDKRMIAWSVGNLAHTVSYLGDNKRARSYYEEGLAVHRGLGDKWGIASSLWSLGHLALIQGDVATAHSQYEAGLELSEQLGDKQTIVRFMDGLGEIAKLRGSYLAARQFHEECLAIRREMGIKADIAVSLTHLSLVARDQGDYATAQAYCEEKLCIAEELEDRPLIAWALRNLGYVLCTRGELSQAEGPLRNSLAICRELDDKQGIGWAVIHLAELALAQGELAAAGKFLQEGMESWREFENRLAIAHLHHRQGRLEQLQGNGSAASRHFSESLGIWRTVGNKLWIAECLEGLAGVARERERPERAARLFGAAAAQRESTGAPLPPVDRSDYDRRVSATRTALGEAAFDAAWAEGQAMTMEQAIEYALEERDPSPGQAQ